MTPGARQALGRWGEDRAAAFLEGQGYRIAARNYRTSFGEIDLIAQKDELTVFCEVKTRAGRGYGLPEEAVTPAKLRHLLNAVQAYWLAQESETPWQVDVIAVLIGPERKDFEIEHFENITA